MAALAEPGDPPTAGKKWTRPQGSSLHSQEEARRVAAIKTEATEEEELRQESRSLSPEFTYRSSSQRGQEEEEAETDFDINTDVIEVIEIKQECQSPGPVSSHSGTYRQKQSGDALVETLPGNQEHMMHYVGLLNGEKVYKLPAGGNTCTFDVPRLKSSQPRKRNKVQEQVEENRPYIKKPLNAFMVFMREHRPFIDEEVKRKGNGVVNMHLAQTWKMMTKEQQAVYYQEAERQRQLHKQLYPEWSNGDNYGRKLYQEERRRVSTKSRGPRGVERNLEPQWSRAARASAPHQGTNSDATVVKLSGNQEHILNFVGLLNGEKVYKLSSGHSSSCDFPQFDTNQPRTRHEDKRPDAKGREALLLSARERRPQVDAAVQCSGFAAAQPPKEPEETRLKDLKAEVAEVCVTDARANQDLQSRPACTHSGPVHQNQNCSPAGLHLHGDQGLILEMLKRRTMYKHSPGNGECDVEDVRVTPNQPRKRSQVPEEEEEEGGKRPYVKKPLNAFMVYMKEQRPFIDLELKAKGNGVVNMYLAQKWKRMTKEEQARYYQEADRQRQLHKQLYPEWSNGENYGKRKNRKQRKLLSNTWTEVSEASAAAVPAAQKQISAEATGAASRVPSASREPQSSQPTVIQLTFPQNPGNFLVCMLPHVPSGWTPSFK